MFEILRCRRSAMLVRSLVPAQDLWHMVMLTISNFSELPSIRIGIMVSSTWQLMIIPLRGSHLCKIQQPHDAQKCTHGLCKCAYQAPRNNAKWRKHTILKKTVLKLKCACQAAATRAHKVVPSGFRDCDFWWESSDENKICKKNGKKEDRHFSRTCLARRYDNKNRFWGVIVLLAPEWHLC